MPTSFPESASSTGPPLCPVNEPTSVQSSCTKLRVAACTVNVRQIPSSVRSACGYPTSSTFAGARRLPDSTTGATSTGSGSVKTTASTPSHSPCSGQTSSIGASPGSRTEIPALIGPSARPPATTCRQVSTLSGSINTPVPAGRPPRPV